jgi:hypothetical protein
MKGSTRVTIVVHAPQSPRAGRTQTHRPLPLVPSTWLNFLAWLFSRSDNTPGIVVRTLEDLPREILYVFQPALAQPHPPTHIVGNPFSSLAVLG